MAIKFKKLSTALELSFLNKKTRVVTKLLKSALAKIGKKADSRTLVAEV